MGVKNKKVRFIDVTDAEKNTFIRLCMVGGTKITITECADFHNPMVCPCW